MTKATTAQVGCFVAVLAGLDAGCHTVRPVERVRIENDALGPVTIAVAPAVNQSGSTDFDPDRVADEMASELSFVEGVSVIPVNRVIGVLVAQGADGVRSADHALEIAELVGADALLVFAITEYDPYDPPRVGITAQLYGRQPVSGGSGLDPVALSREARLVSAGVAGSQPRGLLGQTQRMFDASHEEVIRQVRRFAAARDGDAAPLGWRRYVVSQRHFVRFCSHETLRGLFEAPAAEAEKRQ